MPVKSAFRYCVYVLSGAKQCISISYEPDTESNQPKFVVKPGQFVGVEHAIQVFNLCVRDL